MSKVIFISPSISRGLELWSVNDTLTCKNSESNAFKNIKFLGEILNNWPNDLLGANIYKALEFCWSLLSTTFQFINATSVISKRGTFSPF